MNPFAQGTIPYKWFESKTNSEKDQILADVNKYGIKSFSIGLQYNPDYGKFQFNQYMTNVADPSNPYEFGSDTYKFYQSLTPEGKSALNANSYAKIALPSIIKAEGGVEKALKKASSIVNSRPGGPSLGTYEYVNMVNPFLKTGSLLDLVGDAIGDVGDIVKDLGPIATIIGNAIAPGLGTALSVAAAIDEGADPTDIAKNIAVGEIFNQSGISPEVAAATDSKVLGDLVQDTIKNITLGNDLETSIQNAVLSAGPRNINEFESEINDILDLPANVDTGIVGPMPDTGSLGSESDLPIENIFQTPIDAGSLGVASDLPPTLDDIIQTLPPVDAGSLGQESDLPEIPPSDAEMPPTQGLDTTLPPAPPTLDEVLQGVKDVAKVAALVNTADSVLNPPTQETVKKGFDIVPVPTEWKSPTYDQTFTPVDLDSIFKNLQGTQYQWKPRPDITGGAYMGSPVNISDIVNKIMSAELTPTTMPSQITNAVGGILGPTATR